MMRTWLRSIAGSGFLFHGQRDTANPDSDGDSSLDVNASTARDRDNRNDVADAMDRLQFVHNLEEIRHAIKQSNLDAALIACSMLVGAMLKLNNKEQLAAGLQQRAGVRFYSRIHYFDY